jgi:hypothetical protein
MNFGPSNGYDPGFPLSWISRNGRQLWLKWAANFDGCAGLDCLGGYGFNYRELQLSVAASPAGAPSAAPTPVRSSHAKRASARAAYARPTHHWRQGTVSLKALLRHVGSN